MRFDTLNASCNEYLNDLSERPDNRQRINFGDYALSVFMNDKNAFTAPPGSLEENRKNNKFSAFVNRIIRNYRDSSAASSAQLLVRREEKYREILKDIPGRKGAIQLLLDIYGK